MRLTISMALRARHARQQQQRHALLMHLAG
jgi:hypothetical protein